MWKRGQGLDVVVYKPNGVAGEQFAHSLGKVPEMIWIKRRESTSNWVVGHKGLNGGTDPWSYHVYVNINDGEADGTQFNDIAPTSTHFTVGDHSNVNDNGGNTFLTLLFASVEGISKVGYFDGQSTAKTITTGFQPRFLTIKRADSGGGWYTWDTTRGWAAATNNQWLNLDSDGTGGYTENGEPTATGFIINSNSDYNGTGGKYIYYAHAQDKGVTGT